MLICKFIFSSHVDMQIHSEKKPSSSCHAVSTDFPLYLHLSLSCIYPYPSNIPILHLSLSSIYPYPPNIPILHLSLSSIYPYPPSILHLSLSCIYPYPPSIPILHLSLSSIYPYPPNIPILHLSKYPYPPSIPILHLSSIYPYPASIPILHLSLSSISPYPPSLLAAPPNYIQCLHRADVNSCWPPTLVHPCVGIHWRMIFRNSSLLVHQCLAMLIHLTLQKTVDGVERYCLLVKKKRICAKWSVKKCMLTLIWDMKGLITIDTNYLGICLYFLDEVLCTLFKFFGLVFSYLLPCLSQRFGRCMLRPSSGR